MAKKSTALYLYGAAALIILILIIAIVQQKSDPSPYDSFAQCLTDKGVKMYGAWWCPHCVNQKKMFDGAFDKISYTECSAPGSRVMNQTCKNAGIEGFPTWEFSDGSRLAGEQSLKELSERTSCELLHASQ